MRKGDTSQVRSVLVGIGLAVGAMGAGQFVVFLTAMGLLAVGISVYDSPAVQLGVSTIMVQGVTFGGIALLYLKFSQREISFIHSRVPTLRDIVWAAGGSFALLTILWTVTAITELFGIQSAQNRIITLGEQDPAVFLLLILFSFLLVGPGEELLYRGVIQGRLRETFSAPRAVILTSALFAAIHGPSLEGDGKWVYIVTVFLLALILGAIYEYTDNIVVPALIHGGYNATIFASAYISATQGGDVAVIVPDGGAHFVTFLAAIVVIFFSGFGRVSTKTIDRATVKSLVSSQGPDKQQLVIIALITLGAIPLVMGLQAGETTEIHLAFRPLEAITFGH